MFGGIYCVRTNFCPSGTKRKNISFIQRNQVYFHIICCLIFDGADSFGTGCLYRFARSILWPVNQSHNVLWGFLVGFSYLSCVRRPRLAVRSGERLCQHCTAFSFGHCNIWNKCSECIKCLRCILWTLGRRCRRHRWYKHQKKLT